MTRAIFGQCCGAVGIPEQWGSRWPPCAPVHVFGSWSYTMDTERLQIVPQLRFDIPRFVLIIACSERAHRGMSGQVALRSHLHVWYSPVCVRRGHMSGNRCSLHAVSLEGIRLCGIRRDSSLWSSKGFVSVPPRWHGCCCTVDVEAAGLFVSAANPTPPCRRACKLRSIGPCPNSYVRAQKMSHHSVGSVGSTLGSRVASCSYHTLITLSP